MNEVELAEFPPSLWAVCSAAGLFCYGKSMKFHVVPLVDSQGYCWTTGLLLSARHVFNSP